MTRRGWPRIFGAGVGSAVVLASLVWFAYRPWALTWGATEYEAARAMPGDDVLPDATFSATRAVTVAAPPEQVWPWIIQIGYRRAGFYSYDRLDNNGIPSATAILPEFQDLEVGDVVPMSSGAHARVAMLEPERAMVLIFEVEGVWQGSSWAWLLDSHDSSETRLVTRLRVATDRIIPSLFLDLGEIVMMRKCLLGIKRRAESFPHHAPEGHAD